MSSMSIDVAGVTRDDIRNVHRLLGTHIRKTPVVETDAADFGLPHGDLALKLEFLQHAGSFKARAAFAHVLMGEVPAAGVD